MALARPCLRSAGTGGTLPPMPIAIIVGTDEEIRSMKLESAQRALTRTQAAARLGLTERRVSILVEQAELTPYDEKLFNVPLFLEQDVEALRQKRLKRY